MGASGASGLLGLWQGCGRLGDRLGARSAFPAAEAEEVQPQAAFRAAEGIYFPDPKLATAGIHFFKVLQALGLDVELADRFHTYPNGATAMRAMSQAAGAHVIGSTQVTEIKYTPGIDLVGVLPHEFELATVYALGIPTLAQEPLLAQQLADLLTSDTTRDLRLSGGFELQD